MDFETYLQAVEAVLDMNPDPVVVVGHDSRLLYSNPAGRERWPVGSSLDLASGFGQALAPVRKGGGPARIEWGDLTPGGIKSWFVCSVSPISNGQHSAVAWLCASAEVTDLKRDQDRLSRAEKLMVDTQGVAHIGTWEWNVNEKQAFWSDELFRIYGLARETYTPTYEAYLTMVHPEDRQRVIDATNRVFHEHVPYSHDERIIRPDGSIRYLHTWAHPILDDEGKLHRLVGACQDITERKQAELQIRHVNAELERRVAERTRELEASMRNLESFNAMVSHDLRGPLGVMALAMASLDPSRPEKWDKARERLNRAITQMTTLIEELLAFASIGDAALQRGEVDLSAMAREIVADFQQSSPGRDVAVEIEPSITCFADAGLMRVALQNILSNAWKYTSRTACARIDVATSRVDEQHVLMVRDNGAGFDMKDAGRLFMPFQRLHSGGDFSGTGIGLASVQRILDRHGARVWAESAPGEGATFFIELPQAAPDPSSPAE